MSVLRDWREYDPPTAKALEDARQAIGRPLSNAEIVKLRGVIDAVEYRLAYAEPLVGTGICPHCEMCLDCGADAGPIENHDANCSVRERGW